MFGAASIRMPRTSRTHPTARTMHFQR
jgi:hypothetical protein